MTFRRFYFILGGIFIMSCHSSQSSKENSFDSCTIAIPFENAALAESMVGPGYTGALNNYWGDDTTKLDFKHVFEKGKITASIFYYENGNIEEENFYKCGSLHGMQKTYYQNGQLEQVKPYRYGRLEGIGQAYDENGVLREQVIFKADSMISHSLFDSLGRKIRE